MSARPRARACARRAEGAMAPGGRRRRRGHRGTASTNKDGPTVENVKPVETPEEGSHILEPEFLTCAPQSKSKFLTEIKKLDAAEVEANSAEGEFPEKVPALVDMIGGDALSSTTTKKTTEAPGDESIQSRGAEATSCDSTTDRHPENSRQCGVGGLSTCSKDQPKRPPRVRRATVEPRESSAGKTSKKRPANDLEHAPEKATPAKPERDNVEGEVTPMYQSAISEAKGDKLDPTKPEVCEHHGDETLNRASFAEVEESVDGEEDIYRSNEEIEKEEINKALEVEKRLGVAPEMDIMEYCYKEWRGRTAVAKLMKKGYEAVSQDFTSIRRVRGDNYCALRALLFQALSQTTELPSWLDNVDFSEIPAKLMSTNDWIKQWNLQRSFDGDQTNSQLDTIKDNLELLREKWETLSKMKNPGDKQAACDEIFQNEAREYSLYEAVKFLMLRKAIELYNDSVEGKEVPVFSWLLFARNTSSNPQEFMKNHLNQVGHTGGLEQVEMFLLGYAVQHTIKVFRLYKHETDEFITLYPNDQDDWPVVTLITEDDRHYNVPVGICQETSF